MKNSTQLPWRTSVYLVGVQILFRLGGKSKMRDHTNPNCAFKPMKWNGSLSRTIPMCSTAIPSNRGVLILSCGFCALSPLCDILSLFYGGISATCPIANMVRQTPYRGCTSSRYMAEEERCCRCFDPVTHLVLVCVDFQFFCRYIAWAGACCCLFGLMSGFDKKSCLVWTLTLLPFHRWRWCCATLIVIVEWVLFGIKYVSSWKKEFIKPGYIQYIQLTSHGTGAARHLGS